MKIFVGFFIITFANLFKIYNSKVGGILTEFTANVTVSLVMGSVNCTHTTHAPHPPSKHMLFVPVK